MTCTVLFRGRHGLGNCDYRCSGDLELFCGGDHAFNVYSIPPPEAHTAANYVGCFADDATDRVFVDKVDDRAEMTPEVCACVLCGCCTQHCIVIMYLVVLLPEVFVYAVVACVDMVTISPRPPLVRHRMYYLFLEASRKYTLFF